MKPVGPGRGAWVAVVAAAAWASWLVVAAFVLPVYGSAITTRSGTPTSLSPETVVHASQTLVEVNGPVAAVEMAVPLAATLVVALAFRSGVYRVRMVVGWTATGLLAMFNVLGMLTVGLFVLPVTVALVVACSLAARTAPAAGT